MTEREIEATRLRAKGATYREIAVELGVSVAAVYNWLAPTSKRNRRRVRSAVDVELARLLDAVEEVVVDGANGVHLLYDLVWPSPALIVAARAAA